MKKLVLIGIVLFGLNSFAQDFIADNINHNQILYRGFENKLTFDQIGCETDGYQMETVNCELSKQEVADSENFYIVKTNSSAKSAKIRFISDGQAVDSMEFVVQNLPRPFLYWGNQKSGSNFSASQEIQLKYVTGVTLKSSFEVVGWESNESGQTFSGKGGSLSSEFLEFAESLATGESISIEAQVRGGDGIVRPVKGFWVKE